MAPDNQGEAQRALRVQSLPAPTAAFELGDECWLNVPLEHDASGLLFGRVIARYYDKDLKEYKYEVDDGMHWWFAIPEHKLNKVVKLAPEN